MLLRHLVGLPCKNYYNLKFLPTFFHPLVNRFLELGTIVETWILHPIGKLIHDEKRILPRTVHACFQINSGPLQSTKFGL